MGNKCFKDNADSNVIYGQQDHLAEDAMLGDTPTNSSKKFGFKATKDLNKDLSAPVTLGKNDYQKIEMSFPFIRTDIVAFEMKVKKAERECGSQGFCSLHSLQNQFTSEAWSEVNDRESRVNRLFTQGFFRAPESQFEPHQINVSHLLAYGVLNCGGKTKDKVKCFYDCIQDGGVAEHTHVAANDKDFRRVFMMMVLMTTIRIFDYGQEYCDIPNKYAGQEDKFKAAVEYLLEDVFLDAVYGKESQLPNADFMRLIEKKTPWLFNAQRFREEVFKVAGLEDDH